MLFNTYSFFIFLGVVYALYRALNHRGQNVMLLAASYFFYGFWSVKFTSLLAVSTIVDFFCGRAIHRSERPGRRRAFLTLSVATNLGLLGFFKYHDFFATSMMDLLAAVGIQASLPVLNIVLPVGISFYTFQTMTYSIDIYRREIEPTNNFLDFALFVSFFPQLVAGPIERAGSLLPQIQRPRVIETGRTRDGAWLILVGLFKKAVVADNLARIADAVFNNPGAYSGFYVLLGVYAFAFQIYCDFSGYTDIARGVAKLFGIDLRLNFRQPYFATNPSDFWHRWHISLSTWLRDYLYIPLGGSRSGRTYRNLMITMLLGGLWHGAAMNFVVWGFFHGAILAIHRRFAPAWEFMGRLFGRHERAWLVVRIVFMFHVTCVGWILFRVNALGDVWTLTSSMLHAEALTSPQAKQLVLFLFMSVPVFALHLMRERRGGPGYIYAAPFWLRANAVVYLILMLVFWASHEQIPFIYFQF